MFGPDKKTLEEEAERQRDRDALLVSVAKGVEMLMKRSIGYSENAGTRSVAKHLGHLLVDIERVEKWKK